jgi:hypothetical protein
MSSFQGERQIRCRIGRIPTGFRPPARGRGAQRSHPGETGCGQESNPNRGCVQGGAVGPGIVRRNGTEPASGFVVRGGAFPRGRPFVPRANPGLGDATPSGFSPAETPDSSLPFQCLPESFSCFFKLQGTPSGFAGRVSSSRGRPFVPRANPGLGDATPSGFFPAETRRLAVKSNSAPRKSPTLWLIFHRFMVEFSPS